MICGCPEHIQARKNGTRHISCPRNGRRLREAWPFVQGVVKDMVRDSNALGVAACNGSEPVRKQVSNMMKRGASTIGIRFKYLANIPWICCNMDNMEGALEVIRQVEARPLPEHDPLMLDIWRRLESDIRQVAGGAEPSDALTEEVDLINATSLDESAGEGYHRASNHEHTRAPGAKMLHLKNTTRHI
jgi:hypothetical protein